MGEDEAEFVAIFRALDATGQQAMLQAARGMALYHG